ncbi:NAD(P)-binding domain-containing protein [Sphingomonas sp. HHU CXW]|uniref:Pyrroline-5-carboxylate reductase n=1 Tax=Sphingomonas hominis TaxID=2741495 RepID=A0ABX2JIJ7_9SPHN|nr:pyrroline-5-carboxylate reductase dimerization domain-containing protein [Sphingomonas hominis]NTS65599.1 NAD(P)-binding domain-containing protein [Sphingomonas hominis]
MRLWMIGCGNMGGAMLRRWIASGVVSPADVHVVNRTDRTLPTGVRQSRDLPDAPAPDIVVLGVKPQQLREVAARYAAGVAGAPVLVSMLAGVDGEMLRAAIPGPEPIVVMPNLPVEIGQGVVAVHAPSASPDVRASADKLMHPLGLVRWFDDAAAFEVAGALSGTGPAFLFRFIDALAAAGRAGGMDADDAAAVAMVTVSGAAAMASASDRTPAALADAVASPGGMTREGLNVLDRDAALNDLLTRTLDAAIARGRSMAAERRAG